METQIAHGDIILLFNGRPLEDQLSLAGCGVKEHDILLVRQRAPTGVARSSAAAAVSAPGSSAAGHVTVRQAPGQRQRASDQELERIRLSIIGDRQLMSQMTQSQPALLDAALNNPARFKELMQSVMDEQHRQRLAQMQQLAALEADPFDVEAQRKIEEMIRLQNVQSNMESAMEHNPEAFGSVVMLYINSEVNGHKVKAFVDSGAQATIMSPDCAERCGIMHFCDKRFAGIARGVGTAKILGRIHGTTLKLVGTNNQPLFLQCAITVMEGKDVEMLLGLDMLKRFQACIDLSANVLRIGSLETPFLAEHDILKKSFEPEGQEVDKLPEPQQAHQQEKAAPKQQPQFPEEHINSLMSLGATRVQALTALEASGGNVEIAAGLLFS